TTESCGRQPRTSENRTHGVNPRIRFRRAGSRERPGYKSFALNAMLEAKPGGVNVFVLGVEQRDGYPERDEMRNGEPRTESEDCGATKRCSGVSSWKWSALVSRDSESIRLSTDRPTRDHTAWSSGSSTARRRGVIFSRQEATPSMRSWRRRWR